MSDIYFVKNLCDGLPENMQMKIKAAYWQGCNDGIDYAKTVENKIDHQEDNVVYLKKPK